MRKIKNSKLKFINSGFTLIELLVVIFIIGILSALLIVNFNAVRERAHDLQRKSDLDQLKKALRLYYNDNNLYPETGAHNVIRACGPPPVDFDWGTQFSCGGMIYMKALPIDPSSPDKEIQYQQTLSGQEFCLWATLDNGADESITASQTRCSDCTVGLPDYVVCAD